MSEATAKWVFMTSPSHSATISILQDYIDGFSGSPSLPCLGGHFFCAISFYKDLFLTAVDFCLHTKPPDASRSHIVC